MLQTLPSAEKICKLDRLFIFSFEIYTLFNNLHIIQSTHYSICTLLNLCTHSITFEKTLTFPSKALCRKVSRDGGGELQVVVLGSSMLRP